MSISGLKKTMEIFYNNLKSVKDFLWESLQAESKEEPGLRILPGRNVISNREQKV